VISVPDMDKYDHFRPVEGLERFGPQPECCGWAALRGVFEVAISYAIACGSSRKRSPFQTKIFKSGNEI
jgi:hypothetical protein